MIKKNNFELSLEDFYMKGASLVRLPKDLFEKIEKVVKGVEFTKIELLGESGLIADFQLERVKKELEKIMESNDDEKTKKNKISDFLHFKGGDLEFVPDIIKNTVNEVVNGKICAPITSCYNLTVTEIELYKHGDSNKSVASNGFHWDGIVEDVDMIMLMYFNKGKKQVGGNFLTGTINYKKYNTKNNICELQDNISDKPEVENDGVVLDGIIPALDRNCVFVNNMNPFFIHGVSEYNPKDNDRVFLRIGIKKSPKNTKQINRRYI